MSRDNELMTISVNNVVHTLRECQRDWKYSGRFQPMLAFASELTGISEDGLMEMMDRSLVEEFKMKVVERLGGFADGVLYGVEVAPERFVDVKVYEEDGHVSFLGPIGGNENIYSHVYDEHGKFLPRDFVFDGGAVLKLVKEEWQKEKDKAFVADVLSDAHNRADFATNNGGKIQDIEKD